MVIMRQADRSEPYPKARWIVLSFGNAGTGNNIVLALRRPPAKSGRRLHADVAQVRSPDSLRAYRIQTVATAE